MKHSKEERIAIGGRIYNHEITHREAIFEYGVSSSSIDKYLREYKQSVGIPVGAHSSGKQPGIKKLKSSSNTDIEAYMAMSKEELINELIISKANELRAKKGYEVKGVGANKEFISLNNKNTK